MMIISREIIKPSTSTPSHLKIYNLSQIDQCIIPHIYVPITLLYPNNENTNLNLTPDEKALLIKKALSQCLTPWYPLAGRLHTPTTHYIDCNDEGVVFVEAEHDTRLDKFQHMLEEDKSVDHLFADGMVWHNSANNTIPVGVQLNHFACGGLVVAVSMSHRVGDASTMCSFISHWASVARYGSTSHEDVLPFNPHFIRSPATPIYVRLEASFLKQRCPNRITRKFAFPNSKLSDLKSKALALPDGTGGLSLSTNNPTRFEVLTALLYKTAANPRLTSFQPSCLFCNMDVRKKFIPKLPQTTVGNVIASLLVTTRHASDTSLSVVVSEIRKQKMELEQVQSMQLAYQRYESVMSRLGNEDLEIIVDNRSFSCSCLCGFPFNKVDFGWGKPIAASMTFGSSYYAGFVLMDTPNDDGIEAWVTLETQDMEIFQNDNEMFLYCKN